MTSTKHRFSRQSPEYVILGMVRVLRMVQRALTQRPYTWQHRCSDGVGGCRALSESKRDELLKQISKWCPPPRKRRASARRGAVDGASRRRERRR